ncbi:MAG: wax ester/triacylglycerol synthase family O-acyltransferase [Sulfuritalea sp.]|nr:wax ester/triacylglycerol synthase family O-acyltransferase [Sulfuritalea sp.]
MSSKSPDQSGIETLSGVDGAFLNLETAATPMHVGSLHLFETPAGYQGSFYAAVRRMMESRMVPVLRRRLAALPLHLANPVWVQGEIDLDRHIRRVRIPAPGTWAQLEAVVADLHAELLDRSRPLWMMLVFDGLAGGEQAYYFKIHHAMLDGQAGVALAGALFDTSPEPAARPKAARKSGAAARSAMPGTLALAAAAFRHDAAQYIKLVRELPGVVRTLASLYGRSRVVDTLPVLANVLVSNVPGPPVPLYVDGLRMSGYWPLSIVEHGVGLNITLISYAGTLFLGFVVARNAVPDARQLADDFLAAFEEMKQHMQKPRKAAPKTAAAKPAASKAEVPLAQPLSRKRARGASRVAARLSR